VRELLTTFYKGGTLLFYEAQTRGTLLCGKHALNNYCQFEFVTATRLNEMARHLIEMAAPEAMAHAGGLCDKNGNYHVIVLAAIVDFYFGEGSWQQFTPSRAKIEEMFGLHSAILSYYEGSTPLDG